MIVFKDKSGRDCQPKDLIVYAASQGDTCKMSYAIVVKVIEGKDGSSKLRVLPYEDLFHYDRVAKVGHYSPGVGKAVALSIPERVLVIHGSQVTEKVLEALEKGYAEYGK